VAEQQQQQPGLTSSTRRVSLAASVVGGYAPPSSAEWRGELGGVSRGSWKLSGRSGAPSPRSAPSSSLGMAARCLPFERRFCAPAHSADGGGGDEFSTSSGSCQERWLREPACEGEGGGETNREGGVGAARAGGDGGGDGRI
jgi:hypothetical protein